jgi:hypothetical protein
MLIKRLGDMMVTPTQKIGDIIGGIRDLPGKVVTRIGEVTGIIKTNEPKTIKPGTTFTDKELGGLKNVPSSAQYIKSGGGTSQATYNAYLAGRNKPSGSSGGGSSQPGVSYNAATDVTSTNIQLDSQSPSQPNIQTLSQDQINERLYLQSQQQNTFLNTYPSVRDTIKGAKDIYKDVSGRIISSVKPVGKSISNSEFGKMVYGGGRIVTDKINVIEDKIRNVLQPKTAAEERLVKETAQTTKLAEDFSNEFDRRNILVKNINDKYGETITPEQSVQYNKDIAQVNSIDQKLQSTQNYLTQKEVELKARESGLRIQRENAPSQFVTSILTGIVVFPIQTAKLVVGLLTNPIPTVKGTVEGFKQLPGEFTKRPISTTGELIGNIIGGVLIGSVIKGVRTKAGTIAEDVSITRATNKLLGLSDKVKTKLVTYTEEISIRNKLLDSRAFADDPNVQSLIKTAGIGKAIRTTSNGVETVRYVLKGNMAGKDYTLTFSEGAGKVTSPRIAVTDKGITEVYRPASPSEISKPTKVNVPGQQPIEVSKINQFRKTGTYATQGKITGVKEVPIGQNVIRLSKSESKVYQVGKGSSKTVSLSDVLNIDKQLKILKLSKPKQVAEAQAMKLEVSKTKELTMGDLEAQSKKTIAYQQSVSKFTQPEVSFDIKTIASKVSKQKPTFTIEELPKQNLPKVDNTKVYNQIIRDADKQMKQINTASPQELGFNLRKISTPKVKQVKIETSRFADYTKGSASLGVAGTRFGKGQVEWDFDKLTKDINNAYRNSNRIINRTIIKPSTKNREKESDKNIIDTFNKINMRIGTGNKDIQRNFEKLGVSLKQTQQQKQLQKQLQKLDQPQIQEPRYRYKEPRVPELKLPKVFKPNKKDEQDYKKLFKKLTGKKPKSTSSYTASLGAAFFQEKPINISMKEFKRLSNVRYTGFESRPTVNIISDKDFNKQLKKAVQF